MNGQGAALDLIRQLSGVLPPETKPKLWALPRKQGRGETKTMLFELLSYAD